MNKLLKKGGYYEWVPGEGMIRREGEDPSPEAQAGRQEEGLAKADPHYAWKKNELLGKLKALPYAGGIKVFGSAAYGKENPADIDLVIDLRGKGKHPAWQDLRKLAKEYYGLLDPFIIADAGTMDGKPVFELWARNDHATGWVRSRNKAKMLANMGSQGRPLADILPFKTASGEPVFYHGTEAQFDDFDLEKSKSLGIHFGTRQQAEFMAGENGRVIAAHLDIKNPVRLHDTGFSDPEIMYDFFPPELKKETPLEARQSIGGMKEFLQSQGYDGVVYANTTAEGPGDSYIVFEPGQIRQIRAKQAGEPWETTRHEYAPYPKITEKGEFEEESDEQSRGRYKRRQDWEQSALAAISEGKLDPEGAKERGLYLPGAFKPLPQGPLYHVTTALSKVKGGGLKSRWQLAMGEGTGLGGGTDMAISFTEDLQTALYAAMVEGKKVASGKLTVAEMLDEAAKGEGAKRPWLKEAVSWGSAYIPSTPDWAPGKPYPLHLQALLDGKKIVSEGLGKALEDMPAGVEPVGEGWKGGDGRQYYISFRVAVSKAEALQQAFSFYKTWSTAREEAGGALNPLFFSSNIEALARVPDSEIAILEFKAVPGAMGTRESALGEWRTYSGRATQYVGTVDPLAKQAKTTKAPFVPTVLHIEVPRASRGHFWDEPPAGNLEFWAFKDRPKAFVNEKIVFTFNRKPVAEATVLKIEAPGHTKCEQTGKYEKHHKIFWDPQGFKKLENKIADGGKASLLQALYDAQAVPGVRILLEDYTPDEVELADIQAAKPGQGAGTKAMGRLVSLADQEQIDLFLLPTGNPGSPQNARLLEFYSRFGFEEGEQNTMRRPARKLAANSGGLSLKFDGFLYHGTSTDGLESILKDGKIDGHSYWGVQEIADMYGSGQQVFRVPISRFNAKALRPDEQMIFDPYFLGRGDELDEEGYSQLDHAWAASKKTWQDSLRIWGAVAYDKDLPVVEADLMQQPHKTAAVPEGLQEIEQPVSKEYDAVRWVISWYQDNGIQQMSWKDFQKTFQQFAAKYNALFTGIRKNKPQIALTDLQEWATDQQYEQGDAQYGVSYDRYQDPSTSHRDVEQLVLQINHSASAASILQEDSALGQYVDMVAQSSQMSGHPAGKDTVGWLRVDFVDDDWLLVDEVQSDLVNSVGQAKLILQARSFEEFMASLANDRVREMVREKGVGPGNFSAAKHNFTAQGYTLEKLEEIRQKLVELSKDWAEYAVSTVLEIARRQGIKNVAIHTAETIGQRDPGVEADKVKIYYDNIARSFGFKKKQLDIGGLQGNFWVRTAAAKQLYHGNESGQAEPKPGKTMFLAEDPEYAGRYGKVSEFGLGADATILDARTPEGAAALSKIVAEAEGSRKIDTNPFDHDLPLYNFEPEVRFYAKPLGYDGAVFSELTTLGGNGTRSVGVWNTQKLVPKGKKLAHGETLRPTPIDDLPADTQEDIIAWLNEEVAEIDRADLLGLVNAPQVLSGMLPVMEVYPTLDRKLSEAAVQKYTGMLKDKSFEFDPILVANGKFLDGGHRLEAYHRARRQTIPVVDVTNLVNAPGGVWEQWKNGDGALSAAEAFPLRKQAGADLAAIKAALKEIDELMVQEAANEEEYGETGPSLGTCTQCAEFIQQRVGGTIKGYFHDDNPEAEIGESEGGHDFLIAGKYLVDPWANGYYDYQAVYDLANPQDAKLVAKLYGPQENWKTVKTAGMKMAGKIGPVYHGTDSVDEGREVIVAMELQPNTFYMDEDHVVGILAAPLQHASDNSWHVGIWWVAATQPTAPASVREGLGNVTQKYVDECMRRFKHKFDERKEPMHPELEKRLRELLPGVWLASMGRIISHFFKGSSKGEYADYDYRRIWSGVFGDPGYNKAAWDETDDGWQPKASIDEAIPSVEEAERNFRQHAEQITRTLRKLAAPPSGPDPQHNFHNARVDQPIGYSGANRIVAVVELRDGRKFRGEDWGKAAGIIVHYGKLPADFLKQYAARIGTNYEVVKAVSASQASIPAWHGTDRDAPPDHGEVYFAEKPEDAQEYGKNLFAARLMPKKLLTPRSKDLRDVLGPVLLDQKGLGVKDLVGAGGIHYPYLRDYPEVLDRMRELGYDGTYVDEPIASNGRSILVINPAAIRWGTPPAKKAGLKKYYHISPTVNRKAIKKRGLIPQVKEFKAIARPEGVYLFESSADAIEWAHRIWHNYDASRGLDLWEASVDPKLVQADEHPETQAAVYTATRIPPGQLKLESYLTEDGEEHEPSTADGHHEGDDIEYLNDKTSATQVKSYGMLYHGTSWANADRVQKEGLKTNPSGGQAGGMEHSDGRIYLGADEGIADDWGSLHGDNYAIVHVKASGLELNPDPEEIQELGHPKEPGAYKNVYASADIPLSRIDRIDYISDREIKHTWKPGEALSPKTADHTDDEGFWAGEGGGASGVLPVCPSKGTVCLAWRSGEVHIGNCWGTFGGAIQRGMSPAESAKLELAEETGYTGGITLVPAYVFSSGGGFKYHNFIGTVGSEFGFHPHSGASWETDHISWVPYSEVVEDMGKNASDYHPGLIKLFQESKSKIEHALGIKKQADFKHWTDEGSAEDIGRAEYYAHGACLIYALAVNKLTGWPMVTIGDPDEGPAIHSCTVKPNGKLFDSKGEATLKQMGERYGLSAPFTEPIDENGVDAIYGIADFELRDALEAASEDLGIPLPKQGNKGSRKTGTGQAPIKGQSFKEANGTKCMPTKSAAYLAYELDGKSRASLLEKFPPKFPDVVAHHITIKHGVKQGDPPPEAEAVKVVGYASDESLECAVVEVGGTTERPDGNTYHITLSLDRSKGRKPVDSNELLAQGWQQVEPFPVEAAPAKLGQ